jgi:hypothetical protein
MLICPGFCSFPIQLMCACLFDGWQARKAYGGDKEDWKGTKAGLRNTEEKNAELRAMTTSEMRIWMGWNFHLFVINFNTINNTDTYVGTGSSKFSTLTFSKSMWDYFWVKIRCTVCIILFSDLLLIKKEEKEEKKVNLKKLIWSADNITRKKFQKKKKNPRSPSVFEKRLCCFDLT